MTRKSIASSLHAKKQNLISKFLNALYTQSTLNSIKTLSIFTLKIILKSSCFYLHQSYQCWHFNLLHFLKINVSIKDPF